jgi:hypothetical protein
MIADVDDRRIGLRARAGPVGRTVTSSHTGVRERGYAGEDGRLRAIEGTGTERDAAVSL